MVILAEPIGSRLGHLGLAASDVFSIDATTAGYPGDKASGEMVSPGITQYHNPNGVTPFYVRTLYVCD